MIIGLGSDIVDVRRIADGDRASWRAVPWPHLHATERAKAEQPRQCGRNLRQAVCRQGSLRQGARHRATARRFLARHGRGQSCRRTPDDETDRRRAVAAAGDHAARLRGQDRCFTDRRGPDRAGDRHYFRGARVGCREAHVERENMQSSQLFALAAPALFIACRGTSRYKVAGERMPIGGTKGL